MGNRNIVLKGVIHGGKVITLDDETCLPDGYRITLHLVLEPGEGIRLSAGSWKNMPPELKADLDRYMDEIFPDPDEKD